jgi:hypothetical protein
VEQRRTALVVERDAQNRFVLRTALAQRGFRVLSARSRSEALDLMAGEGRAPDVLLLDDPCADGAYRVVGLPGDSANLADVEVRLVGWRTEPARPRLGEVLSAVDEVVRASVA